MIYMDDHQIDPEQVWSDPLYFDRYLPQTCRLIRYIIRFVPLMDTGVYIIQETDGITWNLLNAVSTDDHDYGRLFEFGSQLVKLVNG